MAGTAAKIEQLAYRARMFGWMGNPATWTGAPDDIPIRKPIFIFGAQGGGLTLLTRILRREGRVVSGAGGRKYWSGPDEIQNIYGPILPPELTGARWKMPPHPVFTGPRSWTYGARELYPLYRKTAADATPELEKALKDIIRLSLHRHARNAPDARFIDKSQTYMLRVGLIHALLHDCDPRFVLMPRDPYVSVYRAATGKARDMRDLTPTLPYEERIDICAEHYANCMRDTLDDAAAAGTALHLCRFEDLLTDTEGRVRAMCDFLDLRFDPDMLPAESHRIPYASRFRDRWFPVKADINAPYEAKIDRLTIDAVNARCGPLIERLGYRWRDPAEARVENAGVDR